MIWTLKDSCTSRRSAGTPLPCRIPLHITSLVPRPLSRPWYHVPYHVPCTISRITSISYVPKSGPQFFVLNHTHSSRPLLKVASLHRSLAITSPPPCLRPFLATRQPSCECVSECPCVRACVCLRAGVCVCACVRVCVCVMGKSLHHFHSKTRQYLDN